MEPTPSNGIIVTKTGMSATLECKVTKGSPEPVVTWRRKEGRKMPDGSEAKEGLSMTFGKVTRHNSGIYVCSADNGFGEPSTAEIKLDVERKSILYYYLRFTKVGTLCHNLRSLGSFLRMTSRRHPQETDEPNQAFLLLWNGGST